MKLVPEALGRVVARNTLLAQRSSPGVLLGVGIVGMVGSTVLACRATLKMDEVLEEAKDKLQDVRTLEVPGYSEKDRSRDTTLLYVQTSVKVVKLYAPAIIIGGASIYALTSSHNILTRRNAALTAAYTALDKGFRDYRERVVEKYGEDTDRELRYGATKQQLTDENGKKKTVVQVPWDCEPSVYAKFFDPFSSNWNREPEYNRLFLQCQQNYANDMLHARGHVFLNEVYDMLGIPRTKAGAVVGWVLSKNGETDNYINFGIFDSENDRARDFVNGQEGAILLDFNVDGIIYDKLDNLERN